MRRQGQLEPARDLHSGSFQGRFQPRDLPRLPLQGLSANGRGRAQKNWVEVYMFGGVQYYLLGDVVPMAVCDSAAAMNMYNVSDAFRYVIPPKGSILGIENLSIPVLSEKSEMAHQFIDFLISKEICLYNSLEYGYNPANKESYEGIDKKFTSDVSFFPDDETFKRLSPNLISDEISQEQLEDIWNSVRLT